MGCSSSKTSATAPASGSKPKTLLTSEIEVKSVNAHVAVQASKASVDAMNAFDSMEFLRSVFNQMDTDGDGSVSKEELTRSFERILDNSETKSKKTFRTLFSEAGLNAEFYVFEQLDTNADGRITWDEFEASLKPAAEEPVQPAFDSMEFLRSVFNQMDADGDGSVSKKELTRSFERILDCSEMKSKKNLRTLFSEAGLNVEFYVFEQLDTNADGSITWDEFEASLKPAAAQPGTKESDARQATAADFLSDIAGQTDAVVEETEAPTSAKCLFLCGW